MSRYIYILLVSLLVSCVAHIVPAQSLAITNEEVEQRIVNTIPSKVPLKIEIINGGMESALEDIEIRVTNIGKKAIFFANMGIASQEEFAPRNEVGFSSFQIGNVHISDFSRSFASMSSEVAATIPFAPGDRAVFRMKKKQAELSWKLMKEYGYPDDSKLILYIDLLRFADGSGYMTPQAVDMPDPKGHSFREVE